MAEGDGSQDRQRRRLAATALRGARGRLTTACEKFATVDEWRANVVKYLSPVLDEFADVLPAGARGLLESSAEVTEPTKEGIARSCEMLRGGLKSVAKEVSSQTGLTAQAKELLRQVTTPVMNLLPAGLRESTLAQALVATGLAAVGIGSMTAVAVIVASGGGSDPAANVGSAASPTAIAQPTQQPTTSPTLGLTPTSIDPCALVTKSELEAVLGRPVEDPRNAAGQPTCVYDDSMQPAGAPNPAGIGINLAFYTTGGAQEFSSFRDRYPAPPTPVTGIGDDAFWTGGSLLVLRGDFWFDVTMYTSDPDAAKLEIAKNIAQIVLGRLP
ncbi:MAG: hypothetical protein WD379_06765 [Dehalococcoidia bacterium]